MCVHVSAFLIADMCGGWGLEKGNGAGLHGFALYGVFVIFSGVDLKELILNSLAGSLSIPYGVQELSTLIF